MYNVTKMDAIGKALNWVIPTADALNSLLEDEVDHVSRHGLTGVVLYVKEEREM